MDTIKCSHCGVENKLDSTYCFRCGYELPNAKPTSVDKPVIKPEPAPKKVKPLAILVGVAAFFLSYFAVQQIFFKPSFDKAMMSAASEINKTCPIMVDKETRLDNAIALPDNILQYNYTLINFDKTQINIDTLKTNLEPSLINTVKTNPDLKLYRDHNTTLAYNYKDKNGEFLLKISVTPNLYK